MNPLSSSIATKGVTPGRADRIVKYGAARADRERILKADTWGRQVANAPQFRENDGTEVAPVNVLGGVRYLSPNRKALYSSTDSAGGYAVEPARDPDVADVARRRGRSVLDLVSHRPTSSDLVEYLAVATRDNQADVVPEYTGGNFGLKPESDFTLDLKTANVNTVSTWVPASRQVLNDSELLAATVDDELVYAVDVKTEDWLVSQILAWSGIQTREHGSTSYRGGATTDTVAHTLRRAVTDIQLEGYEPDGIAVHPDQAEELDLEADANNQYLRVYDPQTGRLSRVPTVITLAVGSGTALVAHFRLAVTVWDRLLTQIYVGQPNDFFLRNAVAVLAEARLAAAVRRPLAVEKITGLGA